MSNTRVLGKVVPKKEQIEPEYVDEVVLEAKANFVSEIAKILADKNNPKYRDAKGNFLLSAKYNK